MVPRNNGNFTERKMRNGRVRCNRRTSTRVPRIPRRNVNFRATRRRRSGNRRLVNYLPTPTITGRMHRVKTNVRRSTSRNKRTRRHRHSNGRRRTGTTRVMLHHYLRRIRTNRPDNSVYKDRRRRGNDTTTSSRHVSRSARYLRGTRLREVVTKNDHYHAKNQATTHFVKGRTTLSAIRRRHTGTTHNRLPRTRNFQRSTTRRDKRLTRVCHGSSSHRRRVTSHRSQRSGVRTFRNNVPTRSGSHQRRRRRRHNRGKQSKRHVNGNETSQITSSLTSTTPTSRTQGNGRRHSSEVARLFTPLTLNRRVSMMNQTTTLPTVRQIELPMLLNRYKFRGKDENPRRNHSPRPRRHANAANERYHRRTRRVTRTCPNNHKSSRHLGEKGTIRTLILFTSDNSRVPRRPRKRRPNTRNRRRTHHRRRRHRRQGTSTTTRQRNRRVAPRRIMCHFSRVKRSRRPPII